MKTFEQIDHLVELEALRVEERAKAIEKGVVADAAVEPADEGGIEGSLCLAGSDNKKPQRKQSGSRRGNLVSDTVMIGAVGDGKVDKKRTASDELNCTWMQWGFSQRPQLAGVRLLVETQFGERRYLSSVCSLLVLYVFLWWGDQLWPRLPQAPCLGSSIFMLLALAAYTQPSPCWSIIDVRRVSMFDKNGCPAILGVQRSSILQCDNCEFGF